MEYRVDGERALQPLPGSHRMSGGEHVCHYTPIEPQPRIGDWRCQSVYSHVAYETSRPLHGAEPLALMQSLNKMFGDQQNTVVLLEGQHAAGHPLPGVYTVDVTQDYLGRSCRFRVDFRVYFSDNGNKHLWAEIYKR